MFFLSRIRPVQLLAAIAAFAMAPTSLASSHASKTAAPVYHGYGMGGPVAVRPAMPGSTAAYNITLVDSTGPVGRAMLGVNVSGQAVESGAVEGVAIVGVTPGSPADQAGVEPGDTLLAIDDQQLAADSAQAAVSMLLDYMSGVAPGQELVLVLARDGKNLEADAVAGELPASMLSATPVMPGMPYGPMYGAMGHNPQDHEAHAWIHHGTFGDLELVKLSERLGEYFGTDQGLLAVRGTGKEWLPLLDGDVIQSIGGRVPQSPGHAMRILTSYEPGEALELEIYRERRRQKIQTTMPERPEHGDYHFMPPGSGHGDH